LFFAIEGKIPPHKLANFIESLSQVMKFEVFGMHSKKLALHKVLGQLLIFEEEIVESKKLRLGRW
jgi:hypothetical protein